MTHNTKLPLWGVFTSPEAKEPLQTFYSHDVATKVSEIAETWEVRQVLCMRCGESIDTSLTSDGSDQLIEVGGIVLHVECSNFGERHGL